MRPAIKAGLMVLVEATGQDGATRCKHPNAFGQLCKQLCALPHVVRPMNRIVHLNL
jgi:hypothetical protein